MTDNTVKLTKKQKAVIKTLREDDWCSLCENLVTPSAKWSLARGALVDWGSVHGGVINVLLKHKLIEASEKVNFAVRKYTLTELGKTIEL